MKNLTRRSQLEGKRIARVNIDRGVSENTGLKYAHVRSIEFTDGSRLVLSVIETGCDYGITGLILEPEQKTPRGVENRASAESNAGRPLRDSAPSQQCPDCHVPLSTEIAVGRPVVYECPRCKARHSGPFLASKGKVPQ